MRDHLSLWNVLEALQRRLERQGLSGAALDRAVAQIVRQLVVARPARS